jgi:hypothetical protein
VHRDETAWTWRRIRALATQDLLHRLALGELIDELVEIPDLLLKGSSMVSTRIPHTTPVIIEAFGLREASAKKPEKVVPSSM